MIKNMELMSQVTDHIPACRTSLTYLMTKRFGSSHSVSLLCIAKRNLLPHLGVGKSRSGAGVKIFY